MNRFLPQAMPTHPKIPLIYPLPISKKKQKKLFNVKSE